MQYLFDGALILTLEFHLEGEAALWVKAGLQNASDRPAIVNEVTLLQTGLEPGSTTFGADSDRVCILEQGNYWGRVRKLTGLAGDHQVVSFNEPNSASSETQSASDFVSVIYDRASRMAFLAGFITSERWIGRISLSTQPKGTICGWRIGFDGGDLPLYPGETITLEECILVVGSDAWTLLEQYADEAAGRHPFQIIDHPPVSWCSWYPYRLSVTEECVLRNAEIAALRLKPLGLEVIEVDLGWQKDNLPCAFDENERFPHGLGWLSAELERLGFRLGAWCAPYTISEFDPLNREHPEWLVQDPEGNPLAYWEWYWEPHGKVFILDLTHPGAREWLREKISSLHARGIRYFKADFIGCATSPLARSRHDPHIAAGDACEAARLGAQVIQEALPDALLLNCGGPEMPGSGHWPLLYTCNDTGNTGFISHQFQQENYQAVACHLFKNHRWGILQPSCLCAGLPGTLEDARMRATVAFLAGGQVDISDDLTSLPEDRWAVLTATLPPLGITAKPVDLFDPIYDGNPYDYSSITKGILQEQVPLKEHPAGSVWQVHVNTAWDEWVLAGVFCYEQGSSASSPKISRYTIPLEMLGIDATENWLAFEFWSGQFLGVVPNGSQELLGYQHPGDFQKLKVIGTPFALDIAFFGPCVKLLCLRKPRPHPWVIGTSFHQSCGAELSDVEWDAHTATLRGVVCRPPGESGKIFVAATSIGGQSLQAVRAEAGGIPVKILPGANDSLVLPLTLTGAVMPWSIQFEK